MALCLPRRLCEVLVGTSVSCGVDIASLSKCLVCESKCLDYSGKYDMHVAVAIFCSALC